MDKWASPDIEMLFSYRTQRLEVLMMNNDTRQSDERVSPYTAAPQWNLLVWEATTHYWPWPLAPTRRQGQPRRC